MENSNNKRKTTLHGDEKSALRARYHEKMYGLKMDRKTASVQKQEVSKTMESMGINPDKLNKDLENLNKNNGFSLKTK